jgi:hypothetical protein
MAAQAVVPGQFPASLLTIASFTPQWGMPPDHVHLVAGAEILSADVQKLQ